MTKSEEIGPGSYDAEPIKPRTSSPDLSKALGRPEIISLTQGPGAYNPDPNKIMYRSPAWLMDKRRETIVEEDNRDFFLDKNNGFGSNVTSFKIQEPRQESPPRMTAGPGEYDWEKGV